MAPARPNGRSLHSVQTTVTDDSDDDTLSLTISMELVPSACVDDLTLIDATLQDGTGIHGIIIKLYYNYVLLILQSLFLFSALVLN